MTVCFRPFRFRTDNSPKMKALPDRAVGLKCFTFSGIHVISVLPSSCFGIMRCERVSQVILHL